MLRRLARVTGSGLPGFACGLFIFGAATEADAAISASERAALIALYNSTDGAHWGSRNFWRNAADTDFAPAGTECWWLGVTCDASQSHVTGLDFYSNDLHGPIPPEIGDLTNLESADFSFNLLTAPIPAEIGNLAWLGRLDLSYNSLLSGSIPRGLGRLSRLTYLNARFARLSGSIPPELGNMTALRTLDLRHNQLAGNVPPQIGSLANLSWLDLSYNQLAGVPPQIGNLANLSYLSLRNNMIAGSIPPELGALTRLERLDLAGNLFSGSIPSTLVNLTGLTDGSSDFRWNALYASDEDLRDYLNAKQHGGDWEGTQTVAPSGLAAEIVTLDRVSFSWSPILYTGDQGGYQIGFGTRAGGPYSLSETTANKAALTATVWGLSPGTTYYFVVDTVTKPHSNNLNTIVSERSAEVSVTTPGGSGRYSLTVARDGPGTVLSLPPWIACGGACSGTFAPGTEVQLAAVPDAGFVFNGWGGACSGTAPGCSVTMDEARTVTASFGAPPMSYYTVTPCRVFDSREAAFGGQDALGAGAASAIPVAGNCSIPAAAKAVAVNVTVTSPSMNGHLRLYASNAARPGTSSINYAAGQTRANNAVLSLGSDGALIVYVNQSGGSVHVVLDVYGYFQPAAEGKFFLRRFFVSREDVVLTSGGSGEECRVGGLPELDRGGHGPATGQRDPPAARARDLGDESVRMETAEQPSDLARLLVFVWREGIGGPPQLLSDVAVREAVQGVFPRQEHLEEQALVARQGIERSDRPAVFGRCAGRQRVELPHGGSGILYLAQGIQVPDIALGRDLSISEQQRHALS